MYKYKNSLKMLPHFNEDMVNFSSPEYSTNRDGTQCKTKKTPEVLKMSLAMAKKQASDRDVIAKPNKSPNATTTFEDLTLPSNLLITPVKSRVGYQPAQICSKDLTQPREAPIPSSPFHIDAMGQGRQYSSSTVSDVANLSTPLHAETVRQGRQCLFSTGSDVANPSMPQDVTDPRGWPYSCTTVSDIDSENTNPPPMCSECNQCRGSLSCVHCSFSFCKRCYLAVHEESCLMAKVKECSQHPGKILEYWCDQDQEAICSDCGLIGNHKGHDVSKLEQRNEEAVREILLIVPKVAQVLETMVESKKAIEACSKEEMEKIHSKVSAYFKDQKDQLQKKEDVMHLQVKQTQQKLASDCNNQVSEIDKHVADLKNQLKNADNCLKSKKNLPFIDVNGNILDTRMLHEQLRNSSLLPCQFNFQEPFCKIDHDCMELNYTKPNLQHFDSRSHQTTLKVEYEFEENSPIKIEDNHDTLVQNNEDLIENLNCCNGKENGNKVLSEFKCQSEDNDIDGDVCIVTSDERKLPVQDKRDLYSSDTASLSKISMSNSNDTGSRIMERMKTDERTIVLKNFPLVNNVQVANWAERWGEVEEVFRTKKTILSANTIVIFKIAESAKACLAAGKWTLNGRREINVTTPINNYTNSIYCGRVSKTHSSSDLLQFMNKFGKVVDVKLDQHKKSMDLFAIVTFSSEKERDLALAYKTHLINGRIIIVHVYGDRRHFYERRKQSVDTKCQISSTKEMSKNNTTLISLNKSQEKYALDESQEKDVPLSSSTPLETSTICEVGKASLETSIICEVGKASFKNHYAPEVHRTYSGKIVPANIDLESNGINPVDVDKTMGIIEPVLDTNQVLQFPEKENSNSKKDLEVELYASPAYSEAQLTSDGWVRPEVPTNSSLEVKVTHIDASGTIWVVPLKELRAHRLLTKILTNFCEDLISSPDSMTWRPGQRAVVFLEGLHERVEILKVTTDRLDSKITVILVDNGKTIHCRGEELLIAPRSGLPFTYPSLAMPVRLYGILMNASLDQTHIEKVMSLVKQLKCTLSLAWSPRNFPLPGTVRYTDADCREGLSQSGNMAEDLINLGCGSLVVSFNDWMYDMSLCDVGWMLDESYFGVATTKAIPSTLPLRAGQWIPCKAVTMDDEVRMVGLLPRVQDLGNSTSSLSLSVLQDAVTSAHKRMALYSPLAQAENAHLFPTVGENVLVFSDGEWCRARVLETTDDGPWVVLVDYIYQEQAKLEHVRRVPVDGGLDEYWHLDPVHAIRASWPLTGTETQTDIDLQKDLLLSSVEYFKVVGFKEISFDDEKHEVVGHFYDQNKRRLI